MSTPTHQSVSPHGERRWLFSEGGNIRGVDNAEPPGGKGVAGEAAGHGTTLAAGARCISREAVFPHSKVRVQ
jgi:hypothetical protein